MMQNYTKLITKSNVFVTLIIAVFFLGCKQESKPIIVTSEDYHRSVDKLNEIMVHDIFSPPVASRIFAYPNIAAYEIVASNSDEYNSLSGQLDGLTSIPAFDSQNGKLNYQLAALISYIDISKELIFSEKIMIEYRDSLYDIWEGKNKKEFFVAKNYALKVAQHIKSYLNKDNYNQTRTMPKYTIDTSDPSKWQPTPPGYMDGIEPHWNKIRPFVIDSAAQFKPIRPPKFSMEKNSDFYKELKEVYDISEEITEEGDSSEKIIIAQFWDCNPYVSVTRGHLMFATKKITPGAHWMGISKLASKKSNNNFDDTIYACAKTSITIADAFISCWDEKYRSNLIRPETLINQHIDENWKPILQTPPFPEYTSGHSVVSGAAAIALTDIFGDNFQFDDTIEVPYGLPIRSFDSFNQAANEAAISRMYGGIHYRAAVDVGVEQGRNLGRFVINNLKMKI